MKYKVYIITGENRLKLKEAKFNYGCGFDSINEAMERIKYYGEPFVNYTILPYIYLTN